MHKVDTVLADGVTAVTAAGATVMHDNNALLVVVAGVVAPLVKDVLIKLATAAANALVNKLFKKK